MACLPLSGFVQYETTELLITLDKEGVLQDVANVAVSLVQGQQLIDDELAGITGIEFEIVATLPATGEKGVIYLVGAASPYDEYIWVEPTGGSAYFEQIGSTSVDLSGYVQASEMHALTNSEIDTIFTQVWPA